jgi:hypothetical protein
VTRSFLLATLLPVLPANAGVWAHYPLDTDYSDTSGNLRHGTLTDVGTTGNSSIVATAGDFKFGGGAMNFSADRDFLAIPAKTFSSGTPYTIAFWARKAAGDTGGAADWDMVIGDSSSSNFFIALNDVTGIGLRWRSSSSAAERQADFAVVKDYNWHHYAVVASGATITLYVDGSLFSTATGKQTGFTLNSIGEAYTSGADFDFHGQIDEMWIFDEALAAPAVNALFQSNDINGIPAFAGFHHRYDSDFSDSSPAGNNGTPAGTAAITTDPAALVTGAGALALDGSDDAFVSLSPGGSYLANQPWTATWWARRGETGLNKGMVMGRADSTSDFIWLNDNFTGLRFRSSTGATFEFTAPKDTELRHYALVADGAGNLSLYLDGQPAQTLSGNTSFTVDMIGKAYPTATLKYNFQGTLDEVRVQSGALSPIQIEQLYDSENPGDPPVPVTRLRIILLAGQSNADGRAATSELPAELQSPQDDIDFYYRVQGGSGTLTTLRPGLSETSQFGPEILLGRRLADLHASEAGTRVAIIKYANGGTNLNTQWKAGGTATTSGDGPEYVTFQQTVTSGIAALAAAYPLATLDFQSMVWMQGESDAVSASSSLYQANLTAFIADVRSTYGASLPFVIARLSSQQTAIDPVHLSAVRAAQDAVAAADPRTAVFSTDSFGIKADNLHFSGAGQQAMGSAFATETAYYEWMIGTFPPADIDAGLAEPGADRDGDGQSNLTEFLGASDPLSGANSFRAWFERTGPATGTLSHPSSPARRYAVERWIEGSNTWSEVLPPVDGSGEVLVRPLATPDSRGIYRVRAELPCAAARRAVR